MSRVSIKSIVFADTINRNFPIIKNAFIYIHRSLACCPIDDHNLFKYLWQIHENIEKEAREYGIHHDCSLKDKIIDIEPYRPLGKCVYCFGDEDAMAVIIIHGHLHHIGLKCLIKLEWRKRHIFGEDDEDEN